jgi:beta-lactamase class A
LRGAASNAPSDLVVRVLAVAAVAPARAQQPAPATLRADLDRKLEVQMDRIAERLEGVLGYAVKDFSTGDSFYRNADLVFPTASSIKLTVLLELMRQDQDHKLSLDEKHTVRRNETPAGDTEPILHFLGDGTVTMTLRDLAIFMVVLSDNSATNILIDRLGMDNISAEIARLGLTQTHLRRHMIDIEAARRGYENVSTPCELMALLEKVRGGGALDAAHTKDYFDLLALPKASPFNKALPATVRIEDKPGALDAVRCDAGIIELTGHPFAMSVMTAYLRSNDEGERAIQEIARLTYEHFNRLSRSSAYGRVISEKNW